MKTTGTWRPFLLLMALLCAGCIHNEDDYVSKFCPGSCTVIKGRITTSNGAAPLKGVPLTAIWRNVHYLSGGTVRRKAFATTDANGNYELRFLLRDDELLDGYISIKAAIKEADYALCGSLGSEYYVGELSRDTTIEVNYNLPRRATLLFELTNKDAMQAGDALIHQVSYRSGLDEQTCWQTYSWAEQTQQRPELPVAAEQPVIVQTLKTKNGVETTETDTLELAPGQQFIFQSSF